MKRLLPHISMALNVALLIVVYLDRRNPMMGFLMGSPFFTLVLLTGIVSIATALTLCTRGKKRKKRKQNSEKVESNT